MATQAYEMDELSEYANAVVISVSVDISIIYVFKTAPLGFSSTNLFIPGVDKNIASCVQ
jgi:hypothetical protein